MIYSKGNVEFFGFVNQVFTNPLNILKIAQTCGKQGSPLFGFFIDYRSKGVNKQLNILEGKSLQKHTRYMINKQFVLKDCFCAVS